MSLTSGTRLGPYEVLAAIGAGGMGEPETLVLHSYAKGGFMSHFGNLSAPDTKRRIRI